MKICSCLVISFSNLLFTVNKYAILKKETVICIFHFYFIFFEKVLKNYIKMIPVDCKSASSPIIHCKVTGTSQPHLEPHVGFFRLSSKRKLMFKYCDLFWKSWFPNKHLLILANLVFQLLRTPCCLVNVFQHLHVETF